MREESRSFELHYCTRDPQRAAFREHLAEAGFAPHTRFYFDSEGSDARIDLARVFGAPQDGKHAYVCGPAGFVDAVLSAAAGAAWPAHNVHREYFGTSRACCPASPIIAICT